MAKFDSGAVVEPLDYTFEAHLPGVKGTIKEPSDRQIADYLAAVKTMTAKYKEMLPEGTDGDDPAEMIAAAESLDPEVVVNIHEDMAGIYARLCSGEPDKKTLLKLPLRIRIIFYGWLQQEVMSPEAAPGAGKPQAATL